MAPRSSTLAWKIPWTEEPGGLQSMGSLRVAHDWATSLSLFTFMHWREGNGNPLQCSCLENPRDGGAWWAAIYGVAQSQTRLKWLSLAKLRVVPDVALGPAAWKFPFIPSPRNTRNPLTSLRNNLWTPCAECIIIACRAKILWYCSVSLSSRLGFLLLPLWCLSDDYFLWMLLCLHPLIKYWCLFISLLSVYFSLFQGFSKWRESAPRWVSEWEGEREEEV